MTLKWEEWISSKECIPVISRCVKNILSTEDIALIKNALGFAEYDYRNGKGYEANDEIVNQLWLFLRNHISSKLKNVLNREILAGKKSRIGNIIKFAFLQHCKDLRRKESPFHKCYRSIREKLQSTAKKYPDLNYRAEKKIAAYYAFAKKPKNASSDIWIEQNATHYREWEAPSCSFNPEDPAENTLEIAHYFWKESLRFFKDEYWIPVRELTSYIFCKYNILEGYVISERKEQEDDDNEAPADIPDSHSIPEATQTLLEDELTEEARRVILPWDADRKEIFFLKYKENLKLREIEARGFKSVQYNIEKAEESLGIHWYNWSPPGEVNMEGMFKFFCSRVLEFVEEAIGAVK